MPALAMARAFYIDPLLQRGGGGPQWYWPLTWIGHQGDFAKELLQADEKLLRGGYCGPDDRGAYFRTIVCLALPDGDQGIFEGRIEGQFANLSAQRRRSRSFKPDIANILVAEEPLNGDQVQALARLSKGLR